MTNRAIAPACAFVAPESVPSDLRAADAMYLAAALVWCEDAPHVRVFLTTARTGHAERF